MKFQQLKLLCAGFLCLGALQNCSERSPFFHAVEDPIRLSDWDLFTLDSISLTPADSSLVFAPNNPLFSDYAHKLRTMWIPNGTKIDLMDEQLIYPVGTILSKTFYYPTDSQGNFVQVDDRNLASLDLTKNSLVETRLLVKRDIGWEALPYVWNENQTEAFLRVAGSSKAVALSDEEKHTEFTYFVPNQNQCSACHVTDHPDGEMHPLGAVSNQLSARISNSIYDSQLETLVSKGWLDSIPVTEPNYSWKDADISVEQRAAAYLNMHCGHCHNKNGAADTSALLLDGSHDLMINMGVCKTPVAAGGGAGNKKYSIVPGSPEESILMYRMLSDQPDEMMPELGRSLVHQGGIEIIREWISKMPGSCP